MLFGQCDDALEFVWEGGESFLLQLANVQQLHTPHNCIVPVRECKKLKLVSLENLQILAVPIWLSNLLTVAMLRLQGLVCTS